MPPPDPSSTKPRLPTLRSHPFLPAIWALQLSSLTGLLIACIFFPRIQGNDRDGGDHILSTMTLVYTFLAIILCLILTVAEPGAYALGWMEFKGYLSLQSIKLGLTIVIIGIVLQTVFIRRREGWRPGWRELAVGLGVGGVVVVSFVAGLAYAVILLRQSRGASEGGGETAPLLGSPEL